MLCFINCLARVPDLPLPPLRGSFQAVFLSPPLPSVIPPYTPVLFVLLHFAVFPPPCLPLLTSPTVAVLRRTTDCAQSRSVAVPTAHSSDKSGLESPLHTPR